MKLRLLAAGTRMPDWVTTAFRDYAGRLPPESRLELVEIPLGKRQGNNPDLVRARRAEGEKMLAAAGGDRLIALDVSGRAWSTEKLARQLADWRNGGRDIALCIGGPDGLDPAVVQRAEAKWSLSPLTLPHALVRVIAAEQIYRAWSILHNHPYHRA